MKVLWLSARAVNIKKSNYVGSNWISALEKQFIDKNITLRIAFRSSENKFTKHEINQRIYYGIPTHEKNTILKKYKNRWLGVLENETTVRKYLEQVIEEYQPDIIHIWGSEHTLGVIAKTINIPTVLHFQGNLTACYHKLFSGFSQTQLLSISTIKDRIKRSGNIYFTKRFQNESLREQEILKHSKNIFGRTDWDRRMSSTLAPNAKYFHCDELLREEFYQNTWKPISINPFKLVTIIRDNIYKGLETIYQASDILKKQEINFEWRIIGIDEKGISYKLIKKYSSFNAKMLPLKLLGSKNSKEIIEELLNANIMVHPSHIDNSPNSVCEGMMLGIPVLSTNVGGIPSLIDDKNTGYLIQDGDPWAMAGCIKEIINNYAEAIKIGERGKTLATKRHDKNKIFNTVIDTYEKIIQNKDS